jgi:hypothetical protein
VLGGETKIFHLNDSTRMHKELMSSSRLLKGALISNNKLTAPTRTIFRSVSTSRLRGVDDRRNHEMKIRGLGLPIKMIADGFNPPPPRAAKSKSQHQPSDDISTPSP